MTGDPAPSGALTIELAGQRRTLGQADMLTFGRAADLVVDEDNPYLHRVVGRFFCHEGNWWVENLGSFIEIEVIPVGEGAPTRLTPHQPEGAPSAQSLPAKGFTLRFESNDVAYEITGRPDRDEAPADGPAPAPPPAQFGPPEGGVGDAAVPPPPGPDAASPFGVPDDPSPSAPPVESSSPFGAPGELSPFVPPPAAEQGPGPAPGPGSDLPFNAAPPGSEAPQPAPVLGDLPFGSAPPFSPSGDDGPPARAVPPEATPDLGGPVPSGGPDASPGEPTLSSEERQLLSILAEPYWRDRSIGPGGLPTDADLAARLQWSEPRVGRTCSYLCNRLTRSGVPGLHGRGRRFALARHVVETGLITGADVL